MQSMTLVVTHANGNDEKIVCSAPDYIAFEREFDKSIAALETGRLTYLYWLAWHGLTRFKRCTKTFDEWVETVASLDIPGDEDEIPPLESPQPIG